MTTKIICDADFLIGLYLADDSNHQKAKLLLEKYYQNNEFVVMNLTKYEFATVLSRKLPQPMAVDLYQKFNSVFVNEVWFEKAWEAEVFELYNSFTKKNISFFDCACMVLAPKINAKIASFDNFYSPEILIS